MARKQAEAVSGLILNAKTLRALAFQWLRYEHGCYLISMERSPFSSRNCPDVLGLNKSRLLVEVEIKCDKADFDRDMSKKHRQKLMDELSKYRPNATNFLYYCVPASLVNHVLDNAPEYAGVLTPNAVELDSYTGFPKMDVIRKALKLHDGRLSIKHCLVMARDQAGTMASLVRDDVKSTVKRKILESQVVALGGELPKRKRKSKKKATGSSTSTQTSKKIKESPAVMKKPKAKKTKTKTKKRRTSHG